MLALPAPAVALTLEPIALPLSFFGLTCVTSDPADPDRLLITEQRGEVKLVDEGAITTILDLGEEGLDLVATDGVERGLLSLAPAPDFAATGLFYVFYTRKGDGADHGDLQIDEFRASGASVDPSTRREVLTIPHDEMPSNHNGGQLQFGPGGFLYVSTGDGGGPDDPEENAQDLDVLLGKILRIDPRQGGGEDYTVPASNPFVGEPGADEIWSYGLRNPWRFSFDRATGDLFIGDVGQGLWEEVDFDPAPSSGRGIDFGWDCREGPDLHEDHAACDDDYTDPILAYENPAGGPAAVTGGYVVRDPALGDLFGRYVYADYFEGEIRSLVPGLPTGSDDRSEGVAVPGLSSFGEDACGRLYALSQEVDNVYRLVGDEPSTCPTPSLPKAQCRGEAATIVATAGAETSGTDGRDVVVGSAGDDAIATGAGDDLVCAGGGPD
ncbi:MAG: PQQ-dependent sugar dehydrogenase, partial [Solirubrobacterales bacterium]